MNNCLIIGGNGFVGKHLKEYLSTYYTVRSADLQISDESDFSIDITNKNSIIDIFAKFNPSVVINLAAQSSVKKSWDDPKLTMNVNVIGTINILEAIRACNTNIRFLNIGSSEEYGVSDTSSKEDDSLLPINIYGISKMTQESICLSYVKRYNLDIVLTRSFNHFGPGQSPTFVVADFCNQVSKIEVGIQNPVIEVGNLNVFRDFSDVRDVCSAYYSIIAEGTSGQVYNVGSGHAYSISEMLDLICSKSEKDITIVVDKEKVRPVDVPYVCANVDKLKEETSWNQSYTLNETIDDTLAYFREKLRK
jgi:GDP-4-dehydro-6-deoxy-D-mannose reductase